MMMSMFEREFTNLIETLNECSCNIEFIKPYQLLSTGWIQEDSLEIVLT